LRRTAYSGSRTADLKSARGSYTTAQQTAYDSAFTSLQSLADGDEDVRSQTLFTFEANESADKTISFANYAAALYLAYADGDRANCPQDAADLTVTALAGGITELDFGDVTRGALCDAVPAGQRLVLARTTSAAIGALIDTGTVTRTYEESLTAFEPTDGDALVVTDTATLEALEQAGGSYTILRDYGDVFWDIRMNINDVTNNFANPFTLPEAPQRGAGRK
jgi:2',3'-cyclic-nucleotide 2'-phosphodiesterase (5'-nucleotidase family)